MVDIHCHLLPGIDDGAKSWEVTLQMCQRAADDGIKHIVATPHCNFRYRYDRDAFQALLNELAVRFPALQFSLGCELNFSYENIEGLKRNPQLYTIGTTPYVLVELSEFGIHQNINSVFFELISSGLVPIIVHPERNPMIQRREDQLTEWISLGCLVQITANSLTGSWGSMAKKFSEKLLKRGHVHVVASDAHSDGSRPPVLSAARKVVTKLVDAEYADSLFLQTPQAIVRGERLEPSRDEFYR